MIKNEKEYKRIQVEIQKQEEWIANQRKQLEERGLPTEIINLSVGMAERAKYDLEQEVLEYEKNISGEFNTDVCTLEEIGRHLIRLRLWKGLTQTELANRLNVSHSSISRDERFEYQGASLEKIRQVFQALEVDIRLASAKILEMHSAQGELVAGKEETSSGMENKQAG